MDCVLFSYRQRTAAYPAEVQRHPAVGDENCCPTRKPCGESGYRGDQQAGGAAMEEGVSRDKEVCGPDPSSGDAAESQTEDGSTAQD